MGRGDGGERGSERPLPAASVLSRRRFVAGGCLLVGVGSQFVGDATVSLFQDEASGSASLQMASIRRTVVDNSNASTNEVNYQVGYQLSIGSSFEHIDITIDNLTTDETVATYENRTDPEGVVTYENDYGVQENHEFEFTFEVYAEGLDEPVLTEGVTDFADGSDPDDNDDLSGPDSPELEWLLIDDNSTPNNGDVVYDAYYAVSNLAEFGELEFEFQSSDGEWASQTVTSTNTPIGKLSHTLGNTGDSYDIVANVKNENGLTVDTATITDVADGTDPSPVGEPKLSDSPSLDSFTVTDESPEDQAAFSVEYTISNTARLAKVDVIFDNRSENDHADEIITDPAPPADPITYPPDNETYWRDGDTYHVTVEVFEEREGVTFPIESGTVSIDARGSAGSKSYPADSI